MVEAWAAGQGSLTLATPIEPSDLVKLTPIGGFWSNSTTVLTADFDYLVETYGSIKRSIKLLKESGTSATIILNGPSCDNIISPGTYRFNLLH